MELYGSEASIWKFFEKWMRWVVSFLGGRCVFINLNFICTRFLLLYSKQCLQLQDILEESIRILANQTEQTYVKQTWHLSFFEAV